MPETKTPQKFPKCEKQGAKRSPRTNRLWEFPALSINVAFSPEEMFVIEQALSSLSESLRVDRLRLEWADKRIKSLEASLKEERLLAQSRANKVEILEASLEKRLDKDVDKAVKTKLYREYEKLKAELSASRATVKDRMKFENEQEKYIQKLKAELKKVRK